MKKALLLFTLAAIFCGGAGWLAARVTFDHQQAAAAARIAAAEQAEASQIGPALAEIVTEADQIALEYGFESDVVKSRLVPLPINDVRWSSDFATGLGAGRYRQTLHPLGIYFPIIHVFRHGEEVLTYEENGLVSSPRWKGGDQLCLNHDTAQEIARLLPAKP